jgi:hypothetical protein
VAAYWRTNLTMPQLAPVIVIADGGYRGTGLVIPHRRERGQPELADWKEAHNRSHRQVRARVGHAFARMKGWKILRDCRLKATASTTPCSTSLACTTSWSSDRPNRLCSACTTK